RDTGLRSTRAYLISEVDSPRRRRLLQPSGTGYSGRTTLNHKLCGRPETAHDLADGFDGSRRGAGIDADRKYQKVDANVVERHAGGDEALYQPCRQLDLPVGS